MKIVIVGGGAIGRLFGYFLLKGNNEITLIDIDQNTLGALQEKGIGLIADDNKHPDEAQSFPVKALSSADSLTEADLVLLLVKSQDTLSAVQDVAHLIGESCPLLCMQTGLGNLEVAAKIVPKENIIMGITFMSGTALSDARVRQGGGLARTYIGELNGAFTKRLENINHVLNRCGIETQMVKRIIGRLWCKVITYSAINPVSAILQVPNGSLTSKMESITLMKRLLDEGREVAKSCSIELVYPDLYELLFDACEKSANNLSSMLQDILNEVPTEIDAQNGAICRYAEENGVKVPTHQTMVELIKLLECWKPGVEQQ
ncbi:ketopantoate reductase family protein [Desulfopila sp. IMCC35006]|uniref:ketopantoate reductase family protein n=1 Tax=Desulfopila sp. IMCC35006 TaxID=2569542 RepID=UPI0010AC583B|nr:ketopantoate reductase family protein [Desulfopila sp. IMCC35006]TKB26867.1 ketopantoate reductase family protein [Desulfopila sp. IMCC35006]